MGNLRYLHIRLLTVLSLSVLYAGVVSRRCDANTIVPIGTLSDLIAAGKDGVTVGDKQFYNFSYLGSPTVSSGNPNPAPTADQIHVAAISGPEFGLSFNSSWESTGGLNQDSLIRFCVRVLDPGQAVASIGVSFNGTVPATGPLTNAEVVETILAPDGTYLTQGSVFNDGLGTAADQLHSTVSLANPLREFCVTKDIELHSQAGTLGLASVSLVDQTFHQIAVPAPATAGGGGVLLAALGLGQFWRNRRNCSDCPA